MLCICTWYCLSAVADGQWGTGFGREEVSGAQRIAGANCVIYVCMEH